MTNKYGRLAMIVRMDKSGLGNQTREIAEMLRPQKILIIDSRPFKTEATQYPEWYKYFPVQRIANGFPSNKDKDWLLTDIDTLLTCEIPYGYQIISAAKYKRIKSFIQYNYEFLDYLQHTLPQPTKFLAPSSWGIDHVKDQLGVEPILLRPPLDLSKFETARNKNRNRIGKRRFLHIQGAKAIHDRNGTETLLEALKYTKSDFELVVKSQGAPDETVMDSRIIYDNENPDYYPNLYNDFDVTIIPRRYGGLCLPMNESLASGLPVVMTDISPNSDLLPERWLVPAKKIGEFMTRTMIDIHEADMMAIAKKIDEFCGMSDEELLKEKDLSYQIAYDNISSEVLIDKYRDIIGV